MWALVQVQQLYFQSNALLMSWESSGGWLPYTPLGRLGQASGSWLQAKPTLAVASIWRVNWQMNALSPSLSVSLSKKKILKNLLRRPMCHLRYIKRLWMFPMECDWKGRVVGTRNQSLTGVGARLGETCGQRGTKQSNALAAWPEENSCCEK